MERAIFSKQYKKEIQRSQNILQATKSTGTLRFQCQLPTAARAKVGQAVAMAQCLDIRPSLSENGNQWMHHFGKTVFEMDQTVAEN